ncbi:MAG: hypothetical protein M3P06_02585 [Acidobacteriota bacterium]|nr:hypothetical protein [Acidobacteriota bacterium]
MTMEMWPEGVDQGDEKWPPLSGENTYADFIFLSIDVIGHSKLFKPEEGHTLPPREVLRRHRLLVEFRDFVRGFFGELAADLEWSWAGDGGIYAIPKDYPDIRPFNKMLAVAVQIATGMDHFNDTHANNYSASPIQVRIVLDCGKAYYHYDKGLRRGAALNFVAKLRVPSERTSITVTQIFLDEIEWADAVDLGDQPERQKRRYFRRLDVSEQTNDIVYAYAPLLANALNREIVAMEDPMQAAHLSYRLGVLHFGTGQQEYAIRAFGEACRLIDSVAVDDRHRYYFRTMLEFYSLWKRLAVDAPKSILERGDNDDRRSMLRDLQREGLFDTYDNANAWNLLVEMEFCLEQLDILARRPVSDPIGLTSLQICLMLERVGYPRRWHGAAISERIRRIEAELDESKIWEMKERGRTIDMACGICSGVAASCLALDSNDDTEEGREHHRRATALVEWLASKADQNYSYRGAHVGSRVGSNEHAMHYASAVLQAFLDQDLRHNERVISDVLDQFFNGVMVRETRLPRRWVTYRNISIPDYCSHVLPVFARTIMARGSLGDSATDPTRTAILRDALEGMARLLVAEARLGGLSKAPGRLYAARDNLGSFGLALLVGVPIRAVPIFAGLRRGMSAVACDELPSQQRRRTIDSNLDRIRKWLDGWLLQWECALYLREIGGTIEPAQLRDFFVTNPTKIERSP